MAEKCGKCDEEVSKDGVKCADCSLVCHTRCVGVITRNKKWKCEGCSSESVSNSSKLSDGGCSTASILEAINAFRKENNDRWDTNADDLRQVKNNVRSIKSDFDTLKKQFADLNIKAEENSKKIAVVQFENKRLCEELSKAKLQITEIEQHTRKGNILISGIPVTSREDVYYILESVAKVLNVAFNPCDVSAAHRLQGKKGDHRPPAIVVCFISRRTKVDWLVARRKRGNLSARELSTSFPDSQVFINEHLTPNTRAVFNGARELLKRKQLFSVWTMDCRVMAKTSPEHRPFRIRDLQHVAEIAATPNKDDCDPGLVNSGIRKSAKI